MSPDRATAQSLQLIENDDEITVRRGDRDVLTYNKVSPSAPPDIDAVYERSGFLHPVWSPSGTTLTQSFPADHPHQQGIFSAWVNTNYDGQPVDFWNLARGSGRVLHESVIETFESPDAIGFKVDLLHRKTNPPVDILRERWKITVYSTDSDYYCFDLESTQRALTDKPLVVEKHRYGGLAFRGPTRWLTEKDGWARQHPDAVREKSAFLNDLGSDRQQGNHQKARWVALTGTLDGKAASIAVLCHKENFRAPQTARLHPTKPYFCFAPCVEENFTIDRDHPHTVRYRFLVTDEAPDPKWIDRQWQSWCGTASH